MRSPNPNNVSSFWKRDKHVGDLFNADKKSEVSEDMAYSSLAMTRTKPHSPCGKRTKNQKSSLKSLASVKRRKWPPPRSSLPPSLPSPFVCNLCGFSIKQCEKRVIGGWGIVSTAARTRLVCWKKISKESFCKSLAKCCTFDEKLEEGRSPLLCFWFSYPPHKWVSG
jgi:hypothetical protein